MLHRMCFELDNSMLYVVLNVKLLMTFLRNRHLSICMYKYKYFKFRKIIIKYLLMLKTFKPNIYKLRHYIAYYLRIFSKK